LLDTVVATQHFLFFFFFGVIYITVALNVNQSVILHRKKAVGLYNK